MTTINRQLRVFLCHSSKDKAAVRELYKKLRAEPWLDPWLDEEKLLPGQDWHMEIEKAVEVTDVVVVLLSHQSVSQEGFVQRELKLALDIADEKPEGTIFITPLRLDDCPAPRRLRGWHYVDYFPADRKDWAIERLIASLKARTASLELKYEDSTPKKEEKSVEKEQNGAEKYLGDFANKYAKNLEELRTDKIILSNGMEFMRVPAGKFIMGSTNGENDERPQHTVDISYDYWMARYSVTNEQYYAYVKAKGIDHPVSGWEKKKDHPVVRTNWVTVMEYCKWLNNLIQAELPSGGEVRLPTEAEWEKAARGTDGREYPWGNVLDRNKCNSGERRSTTPVSLYSPQGDSPYGCGDMVGNVMEWTHSEKKAYPYSATDGREDEKATVTRVVRGGSFVSEVVDLRCAYRAGGNPGDTWSYRGFRLVVIPLLHPS
jgi:formylglycine-generating enzyme required for sulfatase activity